MRNVRLDKDLFIKFMTFFKTWTEYAEKRSQAMAEAIYSPAMFSAKSEIGFVFEDIICDPDSRDILLDIIIEAMDDKESDWIEYYIYELDWGNRNTGENALKVYEEDGETEIPLSTLDDLYAILTRKDKETLTGETD